MSCDNFTTGLVDYSDFYVTVSLLGYSTIDPGYDPIYDGNGNGLIDNSDLQIVIDNLSESLPTGVPAGVTNDAPTTSGFDLVEITDRVNETRISLHNVFDDFEDTDTELSYTIESQSNPSLYDSVSIDSIAGEIVLDAASTGSGRNSIVVAATDTNGISVRSTLTGDLDYANAAPSIDNFTAISLPNNIWQVTGTVEDPDDLVEGFIVQLSGLFNGRAAVQADGTFTYEDDVQNSGASVYAITSDPHGKESLQVAVYVGV